MRCFMKKITYEMLNGKNITEKQISNLLERLGFSVSCKGFHYIKYALMLSVKESDDYLFNMTTLLYPKLASIFGTTAKNVEKAIRYSIEKAFTYYMSISDINEIFKNAYSYDKGKPSNLQFLTALAEYIKYNY